MSCAERNRQIKKILTEAFKPHKVSVKGDRGTAYGWVKIHIAYRPKDRDERDQLKAKVWELFAAAKISIGTYGYDHPGSDYGFGSKCMIEFDRCRDEFENGERVAFQGKAGKVQPNWSTRDWYWFQPDNDNEPTIEVYKRDLVSLEA
jgi:acid stress-induced BolA-like protein IbaG/YrbA